MNLHRVRHPLTVTSCTLLRILLVQVPVTSHHSLCNPSQLILCVVWQWPSKIDNVWNFNMLRISWMVLMFSSTRCDYAYCPSPYASIFWCAAHNLQFNLISSTQRRYARMLADFLSLVVAVVVVIRAWLLRKCDCFSVSWKMGWTISVRTLLCSSSSNGELSNYSCRFGFCLNYFPLQLQIWVLLELFSITDTDLGFSRINSVISCGRMVKGLHCLPVVFTVVWITSLTTCSL